jgi:S1-C subfamily serine protease
VEIAERPLSIGRDPDCDIVVPDARVSRRHAEARPLPDGGVEIADLGSSNGTFVDGSRVTDPVRLTAGQSVQVGDTVLLADPMRPGGDKTVVGQSAVPPPPPPPAGAAAPGAGRTGGGQRRPTTEVLHLRRSVRRNTIIGVAALAAVVIAAGIVTWVILAGGDDERSIAEIVDDTRDSTVEVLASAGGDLQGGGTGWVYDAERGLIVTNAHVVNSGTEFEVALEEDEDPREAELVAVAPCEDLAVLRTDDTEGLRTLPLGDQSSLDLGDTIVALGYPGSASREGNLTATSGVVSVVRTGFDLEAIDVPQYPNVIQTDTVINPGNSGGPLIDTDARLVGVNSAGITLLGGRTIQGQGYAIGVDRVKEIVPTLIEGDSISWTGMGFVFPGPGDDAALEQIGLPGEDGILVPFAVEGTPAAQAGFGERPVLVVGVNGQRIDASLPSYCDAAGETEAGRQITFTVAQAGGVGTQDVRVSVAGEE